MSRLTSLFWFSIILFWNIDTNAQIEEIRYGTIFKDCDQHCFSEVILKQNLKTLIQKNWKNTTSKEHIDSIALSIQEWNRIQNSITLKSFYKLKGRIGCPECDPIGESWLEVKTADKVYRIAFEHETIPQPIKKLLEYIKLLE